MNHTENPTDDSGPAFPRPSSIVGDRLCIGSSGMSLRDWFAGQALAGLASCLTTGDRIQLARGELGGNIPAVRAAYQLADAMLAAREQVQPPESAEPAQ